MAIRMQQRRATAEQWLLADPVLAAGELGIELDTSSFKIGDGINNWSLLSYFDSTTSIQATIDQYVPLTEKGAALGVATLDATGQVPASQLQNVIDSAPGVLDTLNELAAALNDDANFAGTITTALAGKSDIGHNHSISDITDYVQQGLENHFMLMGA